MRKQSEFSLLLLFDKIINFNLRLFYYGIFVVLWRQEVKLPTPDQKVLIIVYLIFKMTIKFT